MTSSRRTCWSALDDDKAMPKVIDFGVAKATGQALTDQTIHTVFGGVIGTPQYMSPEQATFKTANALSADIQRYLTGEPVLAHPPAEPIAWQSCYASIGALRSAAGLLTAAFVAGVVGTSLGMIKAEQARRGERQQRKVAQAQTKSAQGRAEELAIAPDNVETERERAERHWRTDGSCWPRPPGRGQAPLNKRSMPSRRSPSHSGAGSTTCFNASIRVPMPRSTGTSTTSIRWPSTSMDPS